LRQPNRCNWDKLRVVTPRSSVLYLVVGAMAVCATAISCSLDVSGTATDFDGGEDTSVPADSATDTPRPDTGMCIPEAGLACNSPSLCFTGTIQCDGSCNAPPDPTNFNATCVTAKGCDGKYDCEGKCIGEPLSTGEACTTPKGCMGRRACDESCAGELPNVGNVCATAKGCLSTYNCDGACPENPIVDTPCTTSNNCPSKRTCVGTCPDQATVGNNCTTANGCTAKIGCDLQCRDVAGVGEPCSVGGCTNGRRDCTLTCRLPTGANQPCVSATCGINSTRDCMGVCPDPKPGMTTVVCRQCNCPGGKRDVFYDECGICPSCESISCTSDVDAGPDTTGDTSGD
jgi:hypothetical protein